MAYNHGVTDINEYRKDRRKAFKVRWVLILVFLLACMFGGYFFAISSFFSVREIIIRGNELVSRERILELSQVKEGENIFTFDPEETAMLVGISARIKEAEVTRKLPGTIIITVSERSAAAVMNCGAYMIDLDDQGYVLERYQVVSSASLPLISGVDLKGEGTVPGSHIDAAGMEEALQVLSAVKDDAALGEVDVSDVQDIRLYTTSGLEIRIGDCSELKQKFLLYRGIISSNANERDGVLDYIDVSMPSSPTVSFR